MERHKRLTDGDERGGIGARSSLLAQHHDRKEAEDANGYEDGFHDTSRDKAEGEDFVYPLGDGPQHDGRADVGDDEDQLQERAKGHARVGAGTDDVVGVGQNRGVEKKRCGDRGDIRDQEQYARNSCDRLRIDLNSFPLVRSMTGDYQPTLWWLRPRSTSGTLEPISHLLSLSEQGKEKGRGFYVTPARYK